MAERVRDCNSEQRHRDLKVAPDKLGQPDSWTLDRCLNELKGNASELPCLGLNRKAESSLKERFSLSSFLLDRCLQPVLNEQQSVLNKQLSRQTDCSEV